MNHNFMDQVAKWQQEPFDKETQENVNTLLNNPKALEDAFYKDLSFGTGGMRGIMGVGTNRVNRYTFGRNTQGLCNYIKKRFPDKRAKVIIGYDCRYQSDTLAQTVADIFSANDINVYLFSALRPTPEVSFAVRELGAQCGVVLTASHNPPEYNGYKVYWEDGGQIVPPHDNAIIEKINAVDFSDIQFVAKPENITLIDKNIDEVFQNACVTNGRLGDGDRSQLKVVFTSLHGTSITAIPAVLQKAGYTQVHIVEEQAEPDGNFPTVDSPNPEEPAALAMALQKAEEVQADIVIGTDPDADRLGIAVRNQKGEMELLNGNQTMIVMTQFILDRVKREQNQDYFIGSTVVSTPMMSVLASHYNVDCKIGLTGFKWIAKMIEDYPYEKFLGGGEESFGFMVGDFVRDKDAVTAALLACEVASTAMSNGESFFDQLLKAYKTFGLYQEKLISIIKKGKEGVLEIQQMMENLRRTPPEQIGGVRIKTIEDFKAGNLYNCIEDKKETITLPKSDVLIFTSEDGAKIAVRPSGTEPKIKFYFSVNSPLSKQSEYDDIRSGLIAKIDRMYGDLGLKA
jgi:phosphoglucomutase